MKEKKKRRHQMIDPVRSLQLIDFVIAKDSIRTADDAGASYSTDCWMLSSCSSKSIHRFSVEDNPSWVW